MGSAAEAYKSLTVTEVTVPSGATFKVRGLTTAEFAEATDSVPQFPKTVPDPTPEPSEGSAVAPPKSPPAKSKEEIDADNKWSQTVYEKGVVSFADGSEKPAYGDLHSIDLGPLLNAVMEQSVDKKKVDDVRRAL